MKTKKAKKISKAAEFLKKAVRALRGKAGVLRARLLFLASLRRRTAMVGAISRHIRELMTRRQGEAVQNRAKALASAATAAVEEDNVDDEQVPPDALHGIVAAGLSELLQEVVDDDGGGRGYPDWTHTLFDDDDGIFDCDNDDEKEHSGGDVVDDEEPSVMDVIRRRREGDGVEFKMEEEIDHAADMFIRRVRSRMNNRSF